MEEVPDQIFYRICNSLALGNRRYRGFGIGAGQRI